MAAADVSQQRVRSVGAGQVNEVRFASGGNASAQFQRALQAGSMPVNFRLAD
jgi:hypothetical protein